MAGYDTVYNDLDKFEGSGGGCYISWVNNYVTTNGDSIPVGVVLLGEYLTHYFCVSYLSYSVYSYIFISNDPELFSSCDLLFFEDFVACINALA